MNTGEDESTSGLNGRLRPRKSNSTIPSPVGRSSRKAEPKPTQDKPKRNNTPSKELPNSSDDFVKPQSSPELCPYCDRKFASKQSASKHARRIHLSSSKQDHFVKCLYCNLWEGNTHEVVRHMVDSHPNQYFACLDCHTRFPSTTELAEHKVTVCDKQKAPYRSKLRHSHNSTKNKKTLNVDQKDKFSNENKEYTNDKTFNGIVISCELKPTQIQDAADIEDNITTNLILPPGKTFANTHLEKNAVIVLDDVQWNKRITPNFTFHNTDADQILSRLGVVHRSPRVGESTRRAWFKMLDENNPKFEKCFDTTFYTRVASNVQENLTRFLDGSFNFNPDAESTIKTRKSKSSVIINTAEGFPILLTYEQISRHVLDGYMPRQLAPRHKWKWDSTENADNALVDPNAIKSDSHVNNCIVTLVSSLDIWTQLRMKRKYEDVFSKTSSEKTEINNIIASELKEILESRELPASSSQVVKYTKTQVVPPEDRPELPSYLGLSPVEPKLCELQPAVLSGEWVRPRCYVCCACGAQTRDSRGLTSHMSTQHPLAQVQHYEIVGEPLLNADISKHLYVPPNQTANRTRPPRGFRDCTKCKKSIALEDIHQHMLDCAGDTPTVRRKCRTRPFGVRRRRPRLPDNTIRKKIHKEIRSRHRQKGLMRPRPKIRTEVGDAETIRKMIADLPAKRVRVSLNSTLNIKTRKVIENKRNKLKIKRQNADGGKNIVTRSKKVNGEKPSVETQSEDDDEPLKRTSRNTTVKRLPKTSTASSKTLNNTGHVNTNNTERNVKQHGDRNKNTNNQRDGKDIGESGNKNNGDDDDNVSEGQHTPLKHSIALLTFNDRINLKSHETDHDFTSVEKNNIEPKNASTGTLRQFEDETKTDKLDKPPLQDATKTVDPGGLQKSKLNKPRKRLNDCIAMLMQKTSQAQENQSKNEIEISTKNLSYDRDSAKSTERNTEIQALSSTKAPKEESIVSTLGACPTGDGNVLQVPNITTDTTKDLDQFVVADKQSQIPNVTMYPQIDEPDWSTCLTRDDIHWETIRQHNLSFNEGLSAANVNERRRSHGDPYFAPQMTRNESSKRRSSRLKSDSRDYQPRPQYSGIQPYLGIMPPPYSEYYDVYYANMRRPSYDGSMLLPMNQTMYHPHFLPGAATTFNIPMIRNPVENQNILRSDNKKKNMRPRSHDIRDLVQNSESDIASQSPARRKQRKFISSEAAIPIQMNFDSGQIYSQSKSPYGHDDSKGQVNNNYIVRSDATPKLIPSHPRQATASLPSHRETLKNVNASDFDLHGQTQVNSSSDFEYSPYNYYTLRDTDCSPISPIGYETKKSEMFYSRAPRKHNLTSLMEPSTSNFHRKPLYDLEDKLINNSEFYSSEYERRSRISESEIHIMNVGRELIRHPPSTESEPIIFRESPTRHNVEDIIYVDQSTQQLTNRTRTPEEIPLDLRCRRVLPEVYVECQSQIVSSGQEKTSLDSENSDFDVNLRQNHFDSNIDQNEVCDLSQKSHPNVHRKNIFDLTEFTPMQNINTNELAPPRSRSQNIEDDLLVDLNKTLMYSQPSTSGLNGQPEMSLLQVIRTDNSSDSSCILNTNATLQTTIPTITLSPPEDGHNIIKDLSSKIKRNSIQEVAQIKSSNKNTANIHVEILESDPNDSVKLTHKKTQTTDKRKLVPKAIIAAIDDLSQEHQDRLLDILPQYVRSDTPSETPDELANNADQTNKHVSITVSSAELQKVTANTTASNNLIINTNLMPAPSSVIPKKRHSPNATYSSGLNCTRSIVSCSTNSVVTPVHSPTVQDVTSVVTNRNLIRNTQQLNRISNSHEINEQNNDCTTPIIDINLAKRLEVPLEPIKAPVRSILRKVRFNSPRKSFSDDKQFNVKDKANQQKEAVQQNNFEDDQSNVQHTVDMLCETIPAANETLRFDQNYTTSRIIHDPSELTINDSGKEPNIDILVEEQNATVNSHPLKYSSVIFLESETSLTKRGPNETVPTQKILIPSKAHLTNPSAPEKVEINNYELALQTHKLINECAQEESNERIIEKQSTMPMEVSLNNEKIECLNSAKTANDMIKTQKIDTLTVLKEGILDSDNEDISLADIAKLRRPKRTVSLSAKRSTITKLEKGTTTKKIKTKKSRQKKSTNNEDNILPSGVSNKATNRNRRTKILSNASSDFVVKDISSNDELKQHENLIKSTAQTDDVTEINPMHFQELNLIKNFDKSDDANNLQKLENVIQNKNNNRTEENENSENTNDLKHKSSKQAIELQGANDETTEDTIHSKNDVFKNDIMLKTHQNCEHIGKINNSIKGFTDNMSTNIESAMQCASYNITENLSQILHTETTKESVATQKRLLTKKQLIFSKMLCDDETVTITNDKDCDTTIGCTVNLPSTSDNVMITHKHVKRRKSSQRKIKNKRHMKVLNVQSEYESDSSQSTLEKLTEEKYQNNKEDVGLHNCVQKLIHPQADFTSPVDAILADKQTPTSGKRKSDIIDISTKYKKAQLVDTKNIEHEHQSNHQHITENIFEARGPVSVDTKNENILNMKDNTTSENIKRPNASLVPETRMTCYNRRIDYKPKRVLISHAKDLDVYDPYDIDFDETIDITEPSAKKSKHAGSSRRSLHTAKSKSPIPIIQSHISSSDSDSSKSDVPLQKYFEEKLMLQQQLQLLQSQQQPEKKMLQVQQLSKEQIQNQSGQPLFIPLPQQSEQRLVQRQPNNDQEIIELPDGPVDTLNVSETAATANTLEIFYRIDMNGAEKAKSVFIPEEELDTALKKNTDNCKYKNYQQADSQSTSTESQVEVNQAKTPSEADNVDILPKICDNKIKKYEDHKECKKSEEQNKNIEINECANIEENIDIFYIENKELEEMKENTEITKSKDIAVKEMKGLEESTEKQIKGNNQFKESQGCKTSQENEINQGCKSRLKCRENTETKVVKTKKRRRANRTSSNSSNTKTHKKTKKERYIEAFDFFPERKPRKSNLLAAKKNTQTVHIINEGDDTYFDCNDGPTKKCHGETSNSTEEETSMNTQEPLNTTVDTPKQPKTNDNENKNIQKVIQKDRTMDVDIIVNTTGITFHENSPDLENEIVIKENEKSFSVPSKEEDSSQRSSQIRESTLHEETPLNIPMEDNGVERINVETKKSNKNKVPKIRPPGYKEKMYPDIEEFDLFEDKFDKIKRKSRTQAAAAKQTNAVDAVPSTSRASKKPDKRKKKSDKKNYHSSVVPTKGALKGFDGIKISISSQLNMPPNVSPPRQKKRKRSNSKRKRERKDSDSSIKYENDTNLRGVSLNDKDIYEFKDTDDTELLGLRPSTVMDRFRSLNKEKPKLIEKCKDKKGKHLDDSDDEDDVRKLEQYDMPSRDYDSKSTNIGQFNGEIISEKIEGLSNSKDAMNYNNLSQDDGPPRTISNDDEADKLEDDDDDVDDEHDNVCLSRSRFVPPTNDDSSFEWNGSPESGFVHMSDGNDCNCLPNSKLYNDTESVCDSSSCIFRKPNPEKNAVMDKIFKNNAVRLDANDINTDIPPKADLDQLFDSLLETNSNDVSSEQNVSAKNNREISPIPGPSSKLYTSYDSDIPLQTSLREQSTSQTAHSTRLGKRDKKSRSRDADDAFSKLLNKAETSDTTPYVTPPKTYTISNNIDLYRQCILTHNEDACSSDSTEHSNNVNLVDEYVMMCTKNTQTEDPDTIVDDFNTKFRPCSDDEESDLEPESNDVIVLRRNVTTKSHGAQTDGIFEEYYFDYRKRAPRPGDYTMVTNKSTQTRKHKSKHNDDSSDDELFNAFEKTKIILKKFVATTNKCTQTEHKTKSRKTGKREDASLEASEPSTSKEKKTKRSKVYKTETKVRGDSGDGSSAKEADEFDSTVNKDQFEPAEDKPESQSSECQDYGYLDISEYDAGVARQRARRKCTVGKQNVLAEHWSSESEAEASAPRSSVSCAKRGRKKSSAKRRVHVESEESRAPRSLGPTIRVRSSFNSDNEEEGGAQPQHGWIVGDSHKKLVTLLANAKGRKRNGHDKRHLAPDE